MRLTVSAATLLICISWSPAGADDTFLTITGKVTADAGAHLTLAEIEALGVSRVVTTTPWHDDEMTFEGVRMSRLMESVGARGTTAFVLALNNYSTEIPLSDFNRFEAILAYKRNGRYMEVVDKGPLFIIYPYDDVPALKSELYYSRSAWQVRSIEIE